ncbi:hypothetical protein K488DRAFT_56983 [Vararia minispora EC-137]|uniref:Uncharacterized protein n=1 Tax=Vararia minispora EC-137 TaxID=1314806 RepID=A0ACB8QBW5_9AGAM|nr:hypothetical protein K488DRAFT_56983 [Vararia minispora EC-137]
MSALQPLQLLATTERIRSQSKPEVSVGGETLVISKVHMWRNDQPRVSTLAEEAERSSSPKILSPTNVSLTLRRKGGASANASAPDGLDSSAQPYIVALHVLRDDIPATAPVTSMDDPTVMHFVWPAPPTTFGAAAQEPAREGAYFLADAVDGGTGLSLSAWNGPTWSTLRNGIDDTLEYIAVVEFQSGIFLASDKHRVEVIY